MINQLLAPLQFPSVYAQAEGCSYAIQALRDMNFGRDLHEADNCCDFSNTIICNEAQTEVIGL
jgi:hypothetical protein